MSDRATERGSSDQDSSVSGVAVSRKVMEMVGALHDRGYVGLYLDSGMSPSGMHWRYEVGIADAGRWPNPSGVVVRDSIGGGPDLSLPWCNASDDLATFVSRYCERFASLLDAAREPNDDYVEWYQEMLRQTDPDGVLIFYQEYGPDHEHVSVVGNAEWQMPMPPGFRG